ncbi:DUF5317 domain-containing protein [Candidatus Bipolaricaulota bacterium]|nr:DUF5317 domain-containing protein [Candidatus Bipolaricaulota bacterium]
MLILIGVLVGLLLGYALRGRLSNLRLIRLRFLGLVVGALVIQLLIFPLFSSRALFPYATEPLHFASYGLLFLFILLNGRCYPLLIAGAGAALNVLVIGINGGYMPSLPAALRLAGDGAIADRLVDEGVVGNVIRMSDGVTRLNLLGDRLYLPAWLPGSTAFSVGDVVIALGLAAVIAWGMTRHE